MKHLLQNHLRLLILAITPIFLTACGSEEPLITCASVKIQGSLYLTVTDTSGQSLADYEVSYQVNNGAIQKQICNNASGCIVGTGESGEFSITVYKDSFESTSLKVKVVEQGSCGGLQTFAVKLKPLV